ncbi:8178_t:CDS:2 [Entrophospora sp. SA101]|nr:8174_t:CDS:2 [Entrophospora sp. SA101]CAJ0645845.1 8177_t:CDS:2 [Entrophospora sp. SA101]CAJ0645846.1 8178_t:CDS:2 [Entrophospora sp. SA101]CAJ0877250.1 8299_t:CDS:2 [Entrophospora sp. SA101]CAJ0877261.1 8300_t:CDS:2 [Entrophospora sp. SA101]
MEVELKQTSEWSKLEENTPISKISAKKFRWDETHPEAQIGATPAGNLGLVTPTPDHLVPMTSEDLDTRNKSLSDEVLNATFPSTGYKILEPPSGYVPIRTLARKLMATSTPMVGEEDKQRFGKLLEDKDESELPVEELKERKIMRLLLKIKNGTPPMRKTALIQIMDKARNFGAGALLNQILPLLMSQNLED